MFEEGFSDQIQRILKQLTTTSSTTTKRKQQILAFSATYPEDVLKTISSFMKNPQHVLLNVDTPTLQGMIAYLFVGRSLYCCSSANICSYDLRSFYLPGVKQYYYKIELDPQTNAYRLFDKKTTKLIEILSKVSFHQAIVFCNHRGRFVQQYIQIISMYIHISMIPFHIP